MITRILDWLDHRAGVRKMMAFLLLESVPGGARWRYVWGSCLAFVFTIQLITGILLMTAYSPSSTQAWNSVHFIQYQMDFGWLIRGLHHFGSQTMVVLIGLHMLQVVIAGAHLPPREVNWWLGMGLLSATLGLSLTGYLLPWDQKGYWATRVATNIASTIPVLGDDIKQLAVGGPDYGNHTLTRFYALHVAILPLALIVLVVAHITIFRRHGVTSKVNLDGLVTRPANERAPGSEEFWPRQAFYDMLACMVVFGVMLGLVLYGFSHAVEVPPAEDGSVPGIYEHWAKAGQRGKGADLDAAADRDTANYPARPEWYFLFLFQLLKYFPGDQLQIGTVYIPNGVMLLLTILPLFGYGPMRKIGHFFGMLVMMSLLIVVGMLTLFALRDDSPDGILWGLLKNSDEKAIEIANHHQEEVGKAEILARRACQLAMKGTPVEGGHVLIRNDPYTTGLKVFQQKCGSCHGFTAQENDKFTRSLTMDLPSQSHLEKGDLAEIRKEFKQKGIDLSKKIEIKTLEDGLKWRIDDLEFVRTYTVVRGHSKLEISTRSMTDGRSASDLGDFGTEAWVRSLLKDPMQDKHFGLIKMVERDEKGNAIKDQDGKDVIIHALTKMRGWRKGIDRARVKQDGPVDAKEQDAEFDVIAKWLAYQATPRDQRKEDKLIEDGQAFFFKETNKCFDCHRVEKREKAGPGKFTWVKDGGEIGPDLTNYASAEWIRGMIMSPGHKTRYAENNLMPSFRNTLGPGSDLLLQEFREANPPPPGLKEIPITHLPDVEREMIIRWIMRDYRPVYGGTTIAR